ncbi:MAG TPA: cytochrome c oxidase subunit II [Nocardioides sp.]|nr:cytochrome c oxidase subunit II [Nocardioides sp.]
MGRQVPAASAATPRRTRRSPGLARQAGVVLAGAVLLVSLTGCSEKSRHEWSNLAMPDPATLEGQHIFLLWRWAWVAALATGAVVWGLIFYVIWRFRRRSDDEVPIQTRYNLPLEIFYTIAPIIMVVVFFVHTERTQNLIREDVPPADLTVYVVGQQWTWTFNYMPGGDIKTPNDQVLYTVGEAGNPPTLVLPKGETVEFKLHSPDVIHDFGVPGFLEKEDVIPGPERQDNHFSVTPEVIGDYRGKCYELCGVYHSRMLFNVKIVSEADFQAYLQQLQTQGNVAAQPLLGGITSQTQAGLAPEGDSP